MRPSKNNPCCDKIKAQSPSPCAQSSHGSTPPLPSIPILFETKEVFVVFKRAGLSSQGGKGVGHSLDTLLSAQVGSKVHLVHRLDVDTSGVMIVAKSPVAAAKWTKLITSPAVKKTYKALCVRKASTKVPQKLTITTPLVEQGKSLCAITHYKVLSEKTVVFGENERTDGQDKFNGNNKAPLSDGHNDSHTKKPATQKSSKAGFDKSDKNNKSNEDDKKSLFKSFTDTGESFVVMELLVTIDTGRTHQIRRHLASIGCPIIGDDKYGNFYANKALKKHCGVKRLQLCCVRLECANGAKSFCVDLESQEYTLASSKCKINQKEVCIPLFQMEQF